ncbi:MAG TPA: glycoside hydrolase family 2 TIM barrel-domain containing protein [Puia sp.]|nr:glycoside hydrolase family 2 TIM barrel-domain containing protein [Puia sp.]
MKWILIWISCCWVLTTTGQGRLTDQKRATGVRENFDAGWRFFLGDDSTASQEGFDDGGWRKLDLPHDWSIEGAFSEKNSTGQQEGGLPAGVGWYRKHFRAAGARVFIDFDGVYCNSEVWINGHYLGRRPNGYISFRYEITPYLREEGENVIAVRVDNSRQPNSRWYTGSGIYRHVWLVTTVEAAVDHWGVYVTTPEVSSSRARVHVETSIYGTGEVHTALYDADGRQVGSTTGEDLWVNHPRLWSPEHPYCYKVRTTVVQEGKAVDAYETVVGIRYFYFDTARGFILNGEPLKIRGVCMHHDLGALGAAVNTRAIERQLQLLKEMGCNGIRTAHNPPAPELLDLCDRMGFIVMDEAFDIWKKKKSKYDYSLYFPEWHVRDLQDQVRRDRNHPSVFMWSIGNEIREQFDSTGIGIARELAACVRALDTTRPITSALTETDTSRNFIYRSGALDLVGINYNHAKYVEAQKLWPGHPVIASETMSALATRGHYDMPSDSIRRWPAGAKAPLVGANADWTVSAYDNVSAYWGSTHEETWRVVKRLPFISGLYIWTGFDYLGEPTPYPWPARSSYFGIIDLAGFPKDVYYMYQSEWTDRPVLHLFPHWNWKKGQVLDVWAYYSQADEVELYLNGRSLGVRKKDDTSLHVQWRVVWEPGVLKAVSRKDGKTVLVRTVRTAGPAAKIVLHADRKVLRADGSDLSFITVRIEDAQGQLVPDAGNDLHFEVKGGELAGADNGYQADLESFKGVHHKAYNGLCMVVVRAGKKAGRIAVKVHAAGVQPAGLIITTK